MTLHAVLLAIHIAAGGLSVLTGLAALVLRKGGKRHRTMGDIFVVAMVVMGATAAALGRDAGNLFAGGMTIYMVTTAWLAARRRDRESGVYEIIAFVVAVAIGLACCYGAALLVMGVRKADNPFIVPVSLIVSGAVVLAALGDLSVVLRRGLAGAQRRARHLWRMCFGFFIALGSFTAQGAQALPSWLPRQQLLLGSMLLVLAVMLFWLVRVFVAGWRPALTANPR